MNFSMQDQNPGKKFTGIVFAVFLHALIIYAILHWMGGVLLTIAPQSDVTLIPNVVQRETPPPIDLKTPDVKFDIPWIAAPETPITIAQSDNAPVAVKTTPDERSGHPFAGSETGAVAHTPPVVDAKACETPTYPARAIRDEREGVTILSMLIGVDGHVVSSRIDGTSGSRDLDNAALAGLSRCKFLPGSVDGKPEQAWAKIRYVWKLE
jgi:protein TonB